MGSKRSLEAETPLGASDLTQCKCLPIRTGGTSSTVKVTLDSVSLPGNTIVKTNLFGAASDQFQSAGIVRILPEKLNDFYQVRMHLCKMATR